MNCSYPDCFSEVEQLTGPGRPRKYCAEHRSKPASKRAVRFAELLASDSCCADAKRARPGARKCPQHKQWIRFVYDTRRQRGTAGDAREFADLLEAWGCDASDRSFRYVSDDSYIPESRKDRELHKLADEFIAANTTPPDEGEDSPTELAGVTK